MGSVAVKESRSKIISPYSVLTRSTKSESPSGSVNPSNKSDEESKKDSPGTRFGSVA